MDEPPREIKGFLCCFCGVSIDEPDVVGLRAEWGDDEWQWWSAHGSCLTERLHPDAKLGPLVDRFDPEPKP